MASEFRRFAMPQFPLTPSPSPPNKPLYFELFVRLSDPIHSLVFSVVAGLAWGRGEHYSFDPTWSLVYYLQADSSIQPRERGAARRFRRRVAHSFPQVAPMTVCGLVQDGTALGKKMTSQPSQMHQLRPTTNQAGTRPVAQRRLAVDSTSVLKHVL